jgi:hypothetical protein
MIETEYKHPKFNVGQNVFNKNGDFSPHKIEKIESILTTNKSIFYYYTDRYNQLDENDIFETKEEALRYQIDYIFNLYNKSIEIEKKENKV